ncbi:DUF2510 domain-containing protein [Streptomyces sp. Ncost-T10-10d]|uniref:DUF2510 domain-containing protein n=1 Tax=Streptomyces sp. Ncost-T10-10d TaxID=1839774 RepID=UPI00081F1749|nr:DUF2510 domain-containing protein [Streptomyces sp. Ncost-T10-10d]SCF85400.1 Protein of unknown function [Streptomyces sp. Ncost-T10-10d]
MSDATPPGRYPDAATPGTERWWDGRAWTAHTRPIAPVAQQLGPPEPVANADGNGGSGSAATGGGTRIVALAVAGLVVVGAAVTGTVLLGRGDGAEAIRPIDDSGASGGVGSSVAP